MTKTGNDALFCGECSLRERPRGDMQVIACPAYRATGVRRPLTAPACKKGEGRRRRKRNAFLLLLTHHYTQGAPLPLKRDWKPKPSRDVRAPRGGFLPSPRAFDYDLDE